MSPARRFPIAFVALLAGVSLSGCTAAVQAPLTRPSATESPTVPSSSATPVTPSFVPHGTAAANRAWFDAVNARLFAANAAANGRSIIDSLVSAGFDKAAMQVTPDSTAIKGQVDSILFSVKIGDSCLLGQYGGIGYSSAVEPALASGLCLIGKTRVIDW